MKKTILAAALLMGTTATAQDSQTLLELTDCYIEAMLDWQDIDRDDYDLIRRVQTGLYAEAYQSLVKLERNSLDAALMASSAMDQGYGVDVLAQAMVGNFPTATIATMSICNMEYLR